MTLYQQKERIEYIHQLILNEASGCPDSFADKLRLSRRQLYNILSELKDYGADIRYSRKRESFYYASPFVVAISIEMKRL